MKLFINVIVSWILITYSISIGDPFAIVLCLIGFLIMMKFIEDLDEDKNNS